MSIIIKFLARLSVIMFLLSLFTGLYLIVLDKIKTNYEHFFYTELYDLAYYSLTVEFYFILIFILSLILLLIIFIANVAITLLKKPD